MFPPAWAIILIYQVIHILSNNIERNAGYVIDIWFCYCFDAKYHLVLIIFVFF